MLSPSSTLVSGVNWTLFFRRSWGVKGASMLEPVDLDFMILFGGRPLSTSPVRFLLGLLSGVGAGESAIGAAPDADFSLSPNRCQAGIRTGGVEVAEGMMEGCVGWRPSVVISKQRCLNVRVRVAIFAYDTAQGLSPHSLNFKISTNILSPLSPKSPRPEGKTICRLKWASRPGIALTKLNRPKLSCLPIIHQFCNSTTPQSRRFI